MSRRPSLGLGRVTLACALAACGRWGYEPPDDASSDGAPADPLGDRDGAAPDAGTGDAGTGDADRAR